MPRPKHARTKPIVLSFKTKLALFEYLTQRCKKVEDGWVEYDPPGTDVSVHADFCKLHPEWQITQRHVELMRLDQFGSLRTKANVTRSNGGHTSELRAYIDEQVALINERLAVLEDLMVTQPREAI